VSKVVLFSTSTCSWCRRAKRYLKEQRVPFKEVNVERDPDAARDIVRKTG
jgi:glutaredoxin 3